MKRWWQAFWNSLKHVIPVATSIEAVAGGVIEFKTHKSFYAFVGEYDYSEKLIIKYQDHKNIHFVFDESD